MKNRLKPFLRYPAALALTLGSQLLAADLDWVGDVDSDFQNGANWESDPNMPNPATDIHRFKNNSAPTTVGNVTVSLSNSGTSAGSNLGQILFEATAPAFTLGNSTNTISLPSGTHNNAIVLSSNSTVTQTIGSNIVIGDGGNATSSVVNSGGAVGNLLKFTGNITGGTGAGTPGTIAFSFGNTASHNGTYEVTGNITKGGANAISVTKRGSGTLSLSGTNEIISMGQSEGGGSIVIAGGKTSIIQNGAQQSWGGNRQDNSVKINTGAELYAKDASALRSRVVIDGGTLTIGDATTESGMYWDVQLATPGEVFTLQNGGTVNFNAAKTGGYLRGFRLQPNIANQTISGNQSSGNFTVIGGASAGNVFTVGAANAGYNGTTSYTLSGGTLDLKGQNGTSQGFLQINADAGGTSTTTFTLSGTGKLISRFSPSSGGGIVGGANVDAKQIFSLLGGTLVAGRIDPANLRGSLADANGTVVNNGSTIAPGDIGSAGRTTINGNLTINSGTLAIDIGGTTASAIFQETAGSGTHDRLYAAGTGVVVLGGNLTVSLIDSFVPANGNNFTIINSETSISGTFSNLVDGRVYLTGGASFAVNIGATTVTLNDYQTGGGNVAPTISDIANQTFPSGGNTGALAFTITDEDVASVTPSGSSSNTTLVPNGNIVFGGSGANRTVTVTPVSGLSGSATITVVVTDNGSLTAQDTFTVTVTDNFLSWSTTNGVTGGPTGDHDNDGVSNLVEYALVDGGERGTLSGNTITFTKRGGVYGNDITYDIERSSTLSGWTTLTKPPVVEDAAEIKYTFTPGTPAKDFYRLKVVMVP